MAISGGNAYNPAQPVHLDWKMAVVRTPVTQLTVQVLPPGPHCTIRFHSEAVKRSAPYGHNSGQIPHGYSEPIILRCSIA
jgi:hypothetical protein